MNDKIVKLDPKDFGVTKENAVKIEGAFAPKIIERNLLTKAYGEIIGEELTPALAKKAADLYKKLSKCNSGFLAVHKSQKQFALKYGQFVDAWKRKEVLPIDQMKEVLIGIRDYEAIQLKEKEDKLQEQRELEIDPFVKDLTSDFALQAELKSMKFMSKELYDGFLLLQKTKFKERQQKAKDDAEALAKSEAENKLLRKAFQENDAKATKEKARLKKKADDAVKELETIKEGTEEENSANKTDAENMADFITDLTILKMKYSFNEFQYQKLFANVYLLIDKVITYINEKS